MAGSTSYSKVRTKHTELINCARIPVSATLKALITMFIGFAIIAAIVIAKVSIENYIASQNAAIEADVELQSLAEKKEAKVEKKDEPEVEKIEVERVKSSVAFTVPEIKKDNEVKEEQEMKSQEELQETNTAIGAFNVEGNDETAGEVLKAKEVIAEPEPPKVEETKVFDVVEQMPSFTWWTGSHDVMAWQ